MTFDLDSTVITRHGIQEGVEKGYNPKRHGRGSLHPLIAFAAEPKIAANAWMRNEDSASSTEFTEFLDELLTIILPERVGLFRTDSGSCNETIISSLEIGNLKYIMATRIMAPLVRWIVEDKGNPSALSFLIGTGNDSIFWQ